MQIIEVKQNWPEDTLRVDLTIGNYCNYKCWYCWPGCNEGNLKWPDFEIFKNNLCHLLDYYLNNTDKKKFDFHIMGGEITHWPKFFDLIKFFKDQYDCIFTLTTNGSKKITFWEKAASYLDYVTISTHHQFCDTMHVRQVADLLYEKNVIVNTVVLMDPTEWNKCIDIINFFKKSKHSWSIRYLEIIHDTIRYTEEQKKVLRKLRARRANLWWFYKNNKSYKSSVKVIDSNNKKHNVGDDFILLERMNNFKGWECSVGVNWIAVKANGTISAICGNGLYANGDTFNIFEEKFVEKFNPTIQPTICNQSSCWCMFETNMPKKKTSLQTTFEKKIITIYAN